MPPLSYRLTMVYVWTEGRGRLPAGSDRARPAMGKPLYSIRSAESYRRLTSTGFPDFRKYGRKKRSWKTGWKAWNMKNQQTFCDQSWNFTHFFLQILSLLTRDHSRSLLMFSRNHPSLFIQRLRITMLFSPTMPLPPLYYGVWILFS